MRLRTFALARLRAEDKRCLFPAVRQRQEEKRQQEESSKVKERKRKREKYAEKVQFIRRSLKRQQTRQSAVLLVEGDRKECMWDIKRENNVVEKGKHDVMEGRTGSNHYVNCLLYTWRLTSCQRVKD